MLKETIEKLGGPKKVATALGCSPQAVCKWMATQIPAERALQIEALTDGKITCRALRPDLFEKPTQAA